eukprot:Skav236033  [mRNA]  locus=scaffold1509:105068:107097:+ [translate_table: standard]
MHRIVLIVFLALFFVVCQTQTRQNLRGTPRRLFDVKFDVDSILKGFTVKEMMKKGMVAAIKEGSAVEQALGIEEVGVGTAHGVGGGVPMP